MPTHRAAFGGGVPLVNLDEHPSIPCCLVLQLADKLTPTDIADGFGKGVVLDHVLDLQALDADRLVFTNDASREFVLIIPSPISNLGMNTGNFFANLGSVTARLLFLGKPTLCLRQLLLISGLHFWIPPAFMPGEEEVAARRQEFLPVLYICALMNTSVHVLDKGTPSRETVSSMVRGDPPGA